MPFFSYSSLSATTAQTIQGNPPKLSTTLENEIANQNLSLLGVEVAKAQYYSGSTITINTPEITKFSELVPIIKTLTAGEASDSDGDSSFNLLPLSTSSLAIEIRDSTNTLITVSDTNQTLCDLLSSNPYPYKLNVVGDLKLTTQYGDPNVQNYSATHGINVKPKSPDINLDIVGICYAKPNLDFDFPGADNNVWDPSKGFKIQSTTQPNKNFPTVGFNNAFFELKTVGVDVQTLTFPSSISQGSVTATMTPSSTNTIKVTLSGPDSSSPYPFVVPGVITIEDTSNTISYSFDIIKWFIANPDVAANFMAAKNYCDTLAGGNYQLPTNSQFSNTNAIGSIANNNYVRAIGQGILAEWGALYYDYSSQYPSSGWDSIGPQLKSYWTKDNYSSNRQYDVGVSGGFIGDNDTSATSLYVACISN